jgi:hypothetical protein
MKEMKTRKTYEKPTMTVVELQHRTQLLTGSVQANRSSYGTANDGVTDELDSDGNWKWE